MDQFVSGSSLTVCGDTITLALTIRNLVIFADERVVAPILAIGTVIEDGVLGVEDDSTADDILTQRGVSGACVVDVGSCSRLFKRLNIFKSEELTIAMGDVFKEFDICCCWC